MSLYKNVECLAILNKYKGGRFYFVIVVVVVLKFLVFALYIP